MQVRAAARVVAVRLRHERRVHAVLQRHALHQALEADGVVAGQQRVVHVVQVHLELSRPVFGQHGSGGQLLRACGRIDRREHRRVLVEIGHRVDLRLVLAPAGERLAGRLRAALGRARAVDEVELEFDRHDRGQAARGEAAEQPLEHVARVAVERAAVVLVHGDLHLRHLLAEPRHRHQRAGQRQAQAVGVAFVETEARRLHGAAEHVEREHRCRQQHALPVHALEFLDGDALAARNAHLVRQQQVDVAHLRVLGEPGTGLLEIRCVRHGNPECLGFSDGRAVWAVRA